jgi:hypothetical protein
MTVDNHKNVLQGTRVFTTNEDVHCTHNNAPDNPQNKNFSEKASRAVYLKNIEKSITRDIVWKALNSLTRTMPNGSIQKALYVTKLDLPYAIKNDPSSGNKGFGYLHLKTAAQAHWLKVRSPLIIDDKYKIDVAPYINHRYDLYDHKTNLPKNFICSDGNNNSTPHSIKSSTVSPSPSDGHLEESLIVPQVHFSQFQFFPQFNYSTSLSSHNTVPYYTDEQIIKNTFHQTLYENQIIPTEEAWLQYKQTLNQKLAEIQQTQSYPQYSYVPMNYR